MNELLQRLVFGFHWAGFLALVWAIFIFALAFITQPTSEVLQTLNDGLDPRHSNGLLYLAIFHYPVKWILTGNKTFFPWKS